MNLRDVLEARSVIEDFVNKAFKLVNEIQKNHHLVGRITESSAIIIIKLKWSIFILDFGL